MHHEGPGASAPNETERGEAPAPEAHDRLERGDLPRPGETVGRYRVVREIGRGAMGVVFEVVHEKLERTCALKLLRPLAREDEGAVRRFEREAKILAKLSSPNLVHVLDVDRTEAGVPYLVMELLAGITLEERLAEGPVPLAEALTIVLDLCAGAEAAHAAGVVHRDLKPSNVVLTKLGAKIVDFGVAAITSGSMDGSTASVAGTPRTMSPEQLLGERVGPASDVFAIGVVAYRTIAGRYPFEAESMAAQMLAIMRGHAPLASVADVPLAVSEVVGRALERDPHDRIASASALAEALRDASGAEPAPASAPAPAPAPPPPRPGKDVRGAPEPPAPAPAGPPAPRSRWPLFVALGFAAAGGALALSLSSRAPSPSALPEAPAPSPPPSGAAPSIAPSVSPPLAPAATSTPKASASAARPAISLRPATKPPPATEASAPAPPTSGNGFPPHL